jgi:hypothetical protein
MPALQAEQQRADAGLVDLDTEQVPVGAAHRPVDQCPGPCRSRSRRRAAPGGRIAAPSPGAAGRHRRGVDADRQRSRCERSQGAGLGPGHAPAAAHVRALAAGCVVAPDHPPPRRAARPRSASQPTMKPRPPAGSPARASPGPPSASRYRLPENSSTPARSSSRPAEQRPAGRCQPQPGRRQQATACRGGRARPSARWRARRARAGLLRAWAPNAPSATPERRTRAVISRQQAQRPGQAATAACSFFMAFFSICRMRSADTS